MKNEKGFITVFLIIVLVALIIFMISLIGIAIYENIDYGEKEGTIIDKYYRGSYVTTTYVTSGKIIIPNTMYHPESWNFKLQKEVDGEEKTITIEVTEELYNKYNIGDYFKESEEK